MTDPFLRTILLPIDDSEGSVKSLEWALSELRRKGDRIVLVHVIPIPMPEVVGSITGYGGIDDLMVTDPDPRVDQKHVSDARKLIATKFAPILQSAGVPFEAEIVHFATDTDSIGALICKRALELEAASVVVLKHNQGGFKEFFLGSVTKYLAHNCTRPVTILHGDK